MKCFIKHNIIVLIIFSLLCPFFVFAQNQPLCSPDGYTLLIVNGMNTDIDKATTNRDALKRKLPKTFKNQTLTIDFIHNESHVAGIGDAVDVVNQKLNEGYLDSDYDFRIMWNDISQKVNTQKVFFVGHSQGNFYTNNFYNLFVDKNGDIPRQSMGVYGVASPASYVAGGGKYITSKTDSIIEGLRIGNQLNILPANANIDLTNSIDPSGHGFADIYLEKETFRITKEIKESLDKLSEYNVQNVNSRCLVGPDLDFTDKTIGALFFVVDPLAVGTKIAAVETSKFSYKLASAVGNGVMNGVRSVASSVASIFKDKELAVNNPASTVLATGQEETNQETTTNEVSTTSSPEEISVENVTKEEPKKEIDKEVTKETEPTPVLTPDTLVVENIVAQNITPLYVPTPSSGGGGARGSGQRVIVDTTPPNITILGDNPTNLVLGSNYTDAGATASDEQDGTLNVVTTGTVTKWMPGSYNIVYTATDVAGNVATATRVVNVADVISFSNISTSDLNNNGTPDSDEADVIVDSNMSLPPGEYHFNNLSITNNSTLSLEGDPFSSNSFKGVKIVADNLIIDSGSTINANYQGYGSSAGPGNSPVLVNGASYGGVGANSGSEFIYGSSLKPIDLGSGGNSSNTNGGGAIRFVIFETFKNDGLISANGGSTSSGGSIYATVGTFLGSGSFQANGGGGYCPGPCYGPGGGGRIAIYYENSFFSGTAVAGIDNFGGIARVGTVSFINTTNNILYPKAFFRFEFVDSPVLFSNVISNGAELEIANNVILNTDNFLLNQNSVFTFSNNNTLNISVLNIDGASMVLSGNENLIINDLIINNSGTLTIIPERILSITASNISILNNSSISVNSMGYPVNSGPGAPAVPLAGASHGGVGNSNIPASIYGSERAPVDFGSGGSAPQVRGGGAIKLIINDTFENNGYVGATGSNTGSGGSVYVITKNLKGTGTFDASGGGMYCPGLCYGGGGGGRIAIYYQDSTFTGVTIVNGGDGFSESGTIIMETSD